MAQVKYAHVDITDYLAIEQEDNLRYEFHKGLLFAMAGGTLAHSTICNNFASVLWGLTRKAGTCVSFNSEVKVEVKPNGKYVYPDAGLACPKLKESDKITGAITNPRLIVEVSSADSGIYDRGDKLKYYFSLPSLIEYIIVDQDRAEVTVWCRRGDLFKYASYTGLDAVIKLESIEGSLLLGDIYENVEVKLVEE